MVSAGLWWGPGRFLKLPGDCKMRPGLCTLPRIRAGGTEMKLSILSALITKLIILTPKTCSKSCQPQHPPWDEGGGAGTQLGPSSEEAWVLVLAQPLTGSDVLAGLYLCWSRVSLSEKGKCCSKFLLCIKCHNLEHSHAIIVSFFSCGCACPCLRGFPLKSTVSERQALRLGQGTRLLGLCGCRVTDPSPMCGKWALQHLELLLEWPRLYLLCTKWHKCFMG